MKFFLLLFITAISFVVNAQTNVSGGIYSDTIWTKANSPYIVVDTVVVFPGVTLTIEPGVVVRFDSGKYMEVRQANIFAEGTITDSITFTSNAVSPAPGMYTFYLNNYPAHTVSRFNYCNFQYGRGLNDYGLDDSLTIRNSSFTYNTVGMSPSGGFTRIDSCNISNNVNEGVYKPSGPLNYCIISHNQTGVFSPSGTVQNCTIEYNQVGLNVAHMSILSSKIRYNQTGVMSLDALIDINNCIVDSNTVEGIYFDVGPNTIVNSEVKYNNGIGIEISGQQSRITMCDIENNITGIKEHGTNDSIYCNKICNNSTYDFQYASNGNFNIAHNYWCTTDSATIASHIYDGYDNISLGLVSFTPVDSVCAPNINGVNEIVQDNFIRIYPNPLISSSILQLNAQLKDVEVVIYDMLGKEMMRERFSGDKMEINRGDLVSGVYFVKLGTKEKKFVQKLIVE